MRRLVVRDDGQAVVLVAILMLALIFALGLAIDSGELYNGRRTAQEAADAAAFAAAVALYQGANPDDAKNAARADAALDGYGADTPTAGTTVDVHIPPLSGSYFANVNCAEVTISTPVHTSLVPQESGLTTVHTRGVGCSSPSNSGYAVMALDQACDTGTAAISSNGSIIVHGGGIEMNSCASDAGQNQGIVTMDSEYHTDVVGNVTGTWPELRTGRSVRPDPFAGVAKPSTNGLTTYSPACPPAINLPGIYTSAFSSNCTYVFAPGTYIFKGGSLDFNGGSKAACSGSTCDPATADGGVFFFFTSSSYPATGGTCASQPVKIEGGASTTLFPPTTGTYQGMLIWQDNVCTQELDFGGGGSIFTTGSIYAPNATVSGNGQNSDVHVSQIVAKKVNMQNADFIITYSDNVTYQGYIPALVE